jgi:hypothetical protein
LDLQNGQILVLLGIVSAHAGQFIIGSQQEKGNVTAARNVFVLVPHQTVWIMKTSIAA